MFLYFTEDLGIGKPQETGEEGGRCLLGEKEENVIGPKDSPNFASGLCFSGSVLGQWELLGKHL